MRSPARLGNILLTVLALGTSRAQSVSENNDVTTTSRVLVRGNEAREFDWAKLQSRAHVAYVSSGPRTQSGRIIDNDLQTSFQFIQSDEAPTVIVELARSTEIHRVSAVFKAEDAELSVYLLNELPKDPSDLRLARPDASVVGLRDERGMATVNVSASSARYVALRWKRKRSQEPFSVAEISAYSNAPTDLKFGDNNSLADNTKTFTTPVPPVVPVVSP